MYQRDEQSQLDLRLFRIWRKASATVFEHVRKDIESYNIEFPHFMILELIYSKGPHPVQKISEVLSIPSGSITYVVEKLKKRADKKRNGSGGPHSFDCRP
jgi:MarR family 2-MHQ and catechol resistance regulon transcriptional repressor